MDKVRLLWLSSWALALMFVVGCSSTLEEESTSKEENGDGETMEGRENNMHISLTVNGETFEGVFYDNEAVNALHPHLPLNISMSDLNGNEKHASLNESLPMNAESIGTIQSGDIMLYGSDTIVLFYENFSTSHSYTQLGYLENAGELREVVGSGEVNVQIEIAEN